MRFVKSFIVVHQKSMHRSKFNEKIWDLERKSSLFNENKKVDPYELFFVFGLWITGL